MHLCLTKPTDYESDETLKKALGPSIDMMLGTNVQPHVLCAITHTDEIPADERDGKIVEMKHQTAKLFADRTGEVKERRQDKLTDLEKQKELNEQEKHKTSDLAEIEILKKRGEYIS